MRFGRYAYVYIAVSSAFGALFAACDARVGMEETCSPYPDTFLYVKETKNPYTTTRKRMKVREMLPHHTIYTHAYAPKVDLAIERKVTKKPEVAIEKQTQANKPEPLKRSQISEEIIEVLKKDRSSAVNVSETEPKQSVSGEYVVKKGDTLTQIASRFGVGTQEIIKLNQLTRKDVLRVGRKLKLPIEQEMIEIKSSGNYTVKSGDTLLAIAKKFGVDAKKLASLNGIKNTSSIRSGTKLIIPFEHIVKKIEKEKETQAKKRRLTQAKKRKSKKVKMLRPPGKRKLRVTATAYTSHRNQTDSTPFLAAWNNRLRPGMKVIAVSRDLISRYGLTNGSKVRIGGLPGVYTVRDKMNKRFRRRIDIYMGTDRRRALRWGRRSVVIYF